MEFINPFFPKDTPQYMVSFNDFIEYLKTEYIDEKGEQIHFYLWYNINSDNYCYIGQSKNPLKRIEEHKSAIKSNNDSKYLNFPTTFSRIFA